MTLFFIIPDKNVFQYLRALEELYLDENRIAGIDEMALPPVKKLNLSGNELTSIPNYMSCRFAGARYKRTIGCGR